MLRVEQALRTHALSSSLMTDLVGDRFFTHYSPQNRPEGDSTPAPYCVQTIVSDVGDQLLDGPSEFRTARIQVDILAHGIDSARDVAEAMREVADGWTGTVTGLNSSDASDSLEITSMKLDSQRTSYQYGSDEVGWDVVSQDWIITHRQIVPGHVGR